uniref:Patatin-like phospholipase domain containing 2 n=1 Tax=Sinocyclocheilus anshuiensis TaxID=1608454 RepID=A0A671S5V0_9TELE
MFMDIYHGGRYSLIECAITDCSLSGPVAGEAGAGIIDVAKEARKRFLGPMHPSFNLVKIMRTILYHVLPPDGYSRATGRLGISLSRVTDHMILWFHVQIPCVCVCVCVQACICSTYIPVYCGLIPPTLQGVRYVDSGISDNLPQYELKNTITVSPFSGESDICPRDISSTSIHELRFTNTSIQFTLANLYRVSRALFPPDPLVMKNMCKQGYRDCVSGLLQYGGPHRMLAVADGGPEEESDSEDDEETESREDRETQDHSGIEEHIFEQLPPRRLTLCCCSCRERRSLVQSLSNMLPVRMASAILLLYTLPLESALSLSVRLLEWLPDIQEDVGWMKEQSVLSHAGRSVSQQVSARFSSQLELKHSQSVPASFSVARLLPGWVYGGSSTVLDAMLRLDQYQRQLLPGLFCVSLDLRGSFTTSSAHPSASSSLSHQDAMEGLTMRPIRALNTSLLP